MTLLKTEILNQLFGVIVSQAVLVRLM